MLTHHRHHRRRQAACRPGGVAGGPPQLRARSHTRFERSRLGPPTAREVALGPRTTCSWVAAAPRGSVCKSTNGKLPRAISRRQFTGGFEQTLWARSGRPLVGDCRARRARRRWLGPVHAHVGAQGNRRGCSTPPVNQPTRPIPRSIPRPIFRPNFPDQSDRCNRATFSCKGATQTTNSRLVATHAPQPSPRSHLASARKPLDIDSSQFLATIFPTRIRY